MYGLCTIEWRLPVTNLLTNSIILLVLGIVVFGFVVFVGVGLLNALLDRFF